MKRYLLQVVFALLVVAPMLCAAAEIRTGHPRIYITTDMVSDIKQRCQNEYKPVYDKLLGSRWILEQQAGVDYSHMTNMLLPAFLYIVEGDKQYADKTKEYLEALSANPPRNQYMTPEYIRAAVICYDWIYDQLSDAEKQRYAKTFVAMGDYVLTLWRHSDFNNHFINETLAVIYIGVVLHGDGVDDRSADRFLKIGEDFLINHAIPAADEIAGEDGGQAEGFSYNDWGYALPLAYTAEMWRVAAGEDLFKNSSYFKTQSLWHLYCLRPHDDSLVKAEDCPSGVSPGENLKSFIHLVGARCQDGYAQWLGDQIEWNYGQKAWKEILWRDPKLAPRSPESLPLARHFKKLGWVVSRSGWTSKDDTFSLFQCGDFYAGHQHVDANTFVIHKGGSLAIDSGVNEYSGHRTNYYCRTIAHNSITVFDPDETFSSQVWAPGGEGGSNDGGQLRGTTTTRVGEFDKNPALDIADITQFYASENFTYICGDAARAYNPKKMKWFTRQFVHIQPDLFVIFDRVQSTDKDFKKTWHLHSINKPLQEGNQFTIEQKSGRLVGYTIFPEEHNAQLVGGQGKEYWVNGQNYPPDSKSDPESGAWRIEASPTAANENDIFLHVLHASLSSGNEEAMVERIDEENRKGVVIRYKGMMARVLFNQTGDPGCTMRIERNDVVVEEKSIGNSPAGVSTPEKY